MSERGSCGGAGRGLNASDLLPAVAESDATGEIAELYEDIRTTLGVPLVNLVWRTLATVPGGLRWAWSSLRPLYLHGAIYAQAESLRTDLEPPPVATLPRSVLRAVGVDAEAETAIRAMLTSYDRANPLNTVAFSALLAKLDGQGGGPPPPPATPRTPPPPVDKSIPRIMRLDEMTRDTERLVREVNRLGARGYEHVLVSLPRNLAHWPGFLALYWSTVAPFEETGQLAQLVDNVRVHGWERGLRLVDLLADVPSPSGASLAGVRGALETLVPGAMTRMIPVVSLLTRSMPVAGPPHQEQEDGCG